MENFNSLFICSKHIADLKTKQYNKHTKEIGKLIKESIESKKVFKSSGIKNIPKSELAKNQKDAKNKSVIPVKRISEVKISPRSELIKKQKDTRDTRSVIPSKKISEIKINPKTELPKNQKDTKDTKSEITSKNFSEINYKYRFKHSGVTEMKNKSITNSNSNYKKPVGIRPIDLSKLNDCGDKNNDEFSNIFISSKKLDKGKIHSNMSHQEGSKQKTKNTPQDDTNVIYKRKSTTKDDIDLTNKPVTLINESNSFSPSKPDKNFIQSNIDVISSMSKKSVKKSKSLLTKRSRKRIETKLTCSKIENSQTNLSVISKKKYLNPKYSQQTLNSIISKPTIRKNKKSKVTVINANPDDEKENLTVCSSKLNNEDKNTKNGFNPIQMEFLYYSTILKENSPKLSEEKDRQKVILWLKKMFKPEYMTSVLQIKRNQYLMFMSLSVLNNEVYNILSYCPPNNVLPDIIELPEIDIKPAQWELDNTWNTTLENLPQEEQTTECSVHKDINKCKCDHKWDKLLDEEFKYLLYLSKPFTYLLKNSEDKSKIQAWILKLCKINNNSCSIMRGIRNDYIMLLLGYIHELLVVAPFNTYPTQEPLKPLKDILKSSDINKILDPKNDDTQSFLRNQPVPTEGAFCYVAVTGDLVDSKTMQDLF